MNKEFMEAIEGISQEKHIPKDVLIKTVEDALLSAYKKQHEQNTNARVVIDPDEGDVRIFVKMEIVEEVENEYAEISLEEAHELDDRFQLGDSIEYEVTVDDFDSVFGRIAAQTAKQVVVQKIREAERGIIFEDFKDRKGEIVTGIVQRKSGKSIFVDLGQSEGILPAREQVDGERFEVNDRLKVYIMDVKTSTKGPQIYLSRSHPGLVKGLFELEVPEIQDGTVEIKGIAREAGSRTKIAVWTEDENVDPVGSCVGARGARVQEIVKELNGEKIDIIAWSEDPDELIRNVLSPAKVEEVIIDEENKMALAIVPDYQLSLAIGKTGQNVRLAVKVSGWNIDIKSQTQYYGEDFEGYEDEQSPEDEMEVGEDAVELLDEEPVEVEEPAEAEETEEPAEAAEEKADEE